MRTPEQIRKAEQRDADARSARAVRNALDELIEAVDFYGHSVGKLSRIKPALEKAKNAVGKSGRPDVWPGDPGYVHPQTAELKTFAGRAVPPQSDTENG